MKIKKNYFTVFLLMWKNIILNILWMYIEHYLENVIKLKNPYIHLQEYKWWSSKIKKNGLKR